jgi:hypothetical protein
MKKNLLILVAFISLQIFGQKKEDIGPDVSKMIIATTKLDFDGVIDYTYPGLFDLAPKEMLVDLMKETFSNDMMSISFIETEIKTTISDVVHIKEAHYALVIFPSIVNMSF